MSPPSSRKFNLDRSMFYAGIFPPQPKIGSLYLKNPKYFILNLDPNIIDS